LVDLAAQGLLDLEQHRGFQVRRFTYDEFRSMVAARIFVAEGIFRRVTERGPIDMDPAAIASVRRRAESAARAARAGELDILIGHDLRFWREIMALAGNAHVGEFLDRLRTHTWIYTVPLLRRERSLAGVCWSDHSELAAAVADRDAVVARRIVEAYDDHALALVDKLARS
jgi:DNA-binding GntR family transcriptional regulator